MNRAFARPARPCASRFRRTLCALAVFVGLGFVTCEIAAAPVPWNDATVTYLAKGKPLTQVLKDILATQPFPVVIKADVRGEVHGQFDDSARSIFSGLESAYGFTWYFDGAVMYVSPSSDSKSEVVAIAPLSPAQALQALQQLGLIEPRFPVRLSGGSVLVSGPTRYVELVARALESERARAAQQTLQRSVPTGRRVAAASTSAVEIRVFPLRYAQAQDSERAISGDRYTVYGVATLLRGLLSGVSAKQTALDASRDDAALMADSARMLQASGDDGGGEAASLRRQAMSTYLAAANRQSAASDATLAAHIQADVRTNSVVIMDTPAMMPYYQSTIEQLDRPQTLVEIDVAIIDIASSAIRDLGVDLSGHSIRGGLGNGGTDVIAATGQAGQFQAVFGSSSAQISARLSALEKQGRARVLSRPKIMTLDNTEAIIGDDTSVYVRVAGDRTTDLYPVTSGLRFRVTPLIIPMGERPSRIKLSVGIVDGGFTRDAVVDGIPRVNKKYLATQTVVEDGQSLLLGGHQFENVDNALSGVPGLSRIPVVGALFRHRTTLREQTERLFLITPRRVADDTNDTLTLKSLLPMQPDRLQQVGDRRVFEASPGPLTTERHPLEPNQFRNVWAAPTGAARVQEPLAPIARPTPVPADPLAPLPTPKLKLIPASAPTPKLKVTPAPAPTPMANPAPADWIKPIEPVTPGRRGVDHARR